MHRLNGQLFPFQRKTNSDFFPVGFFLYYHFTLRHKEVIENTALIN